MIDRALFKLPGIRGMLAITLLLALARAVSVVAQAFGLASAIVGLWGGAALEAQAAWIALFVAAFIMRQVFASIQGELLDRYARERAAELREQLLDRTFSEGPALVQQLGSASVAQTLIDGIEDVRIYIGLIVPKIVSVVAVPAVLLVVIFSLDWVSGIIALVCYPFIILYMVMIGHTARDDAAHRHGEFLRMANHFMDSLAGIGELKAFGVDRAYEERIFAASERFRQLTMKTLRVATLSSTVLDIFATLALAGVAIMLGFRLVGGSMAFFPALAVLIMVPEYFRPIREFAADYHASLDGRSAFAAIRKVLSDDSTGEAAQSAGAVEAARPSNAGWEANGAAAAEAAEQGAASRGGLRASLCESVSSPSLALAHLGFSYPDFPDALAELNLVVSGPCKVGIIGPSGSGKSTLMRLLGGFADPSYGSFMLNEMPLNTLRDERWQHRASFIPQDPYLFNATLRDNVAFYRPDATNEQVLRAVHLAGLDELVAQLPDGLDTMVGQGARTLSGGQAHRIALARAFLDDSRDVLLLDEPTAHLDIETELELKSRLIPLMEGKLVFFATHRLHWLAQMDYVVELEGGRIAWQGPAAEWRKVRASRFARAWGLVNEEALSGATYGGVGLTEEAPSCFDRGWAPDAAIAQGVSGRDGLSAFDASESSVAPDACSSCGGRSAGQVASPGEEERAASPECRTRGPIVRMRAAWAADTWVKPFFARYWRVLGLALLLGLVAAAFAGALMFASGYMISLAATLPFTVLAVHVPSLYVRIFGVGKPVLSYAERLVSHDWALRMTSELRRRLYRDFDKASVGARATRRMGDMLGLLAEDIEHVQDLYLRTIFPLAIAWLLYLVLIVALGIFDGGVALAMALLLGVVVFVLPVVSLCVNGARLERLKAEKAELYAELTDNVRGVADWVYAGRGDEYRHHHQALQQQADCLDAQVARFGRWRDVAAQVAFALAALALLVWASLEFAPANPAVAGASGALAAMTPENAVTHAGNWIAAFVLCLFPLIESFSPASEAAMGLVTYGDSIERMNGLSADCAAGVQSASAEKACESAACSSELLHADAAGDCAATDAFDERAAVRAAEGGFSARADESTSSFGVQAGTTTAAALAFENVSFAYSHSGAPVLDALNLFIPAGQKLAVLGQSGAGKSTLVALAHGDYAASAGRILVGGRDAAVLGDDAARFVGLIGQNPHLFNWTLRENLAIGKPSATDAELRDVLDQVGLSDLLSRLPQGLDTMVDECGRRFSGGERHRIALARVLLAGAPVVILDEPFAGLDPATERALIDTIFKTLADRTVIMVTHHLQGVSSCDRAVFLEQGRIVIDGAPDQLERENERYRLLLAMDQGMCG